MTLTRRTPAQYFSWPILRLLVFACAFSLLHAAAQTPLNLRGVINFDSSAWRFQIGDDPTWAQPGFDDSKWATVNLAQPLSEQGYEPYTGYAWYRLHLSAAQLAAFGTPATNAPLELLITGNSVGQLVVSVNGVETGRTKGMTEPPVEYASLPFAASLFAPDASGNRVIAIRTWADPKVNIHRGLLTRVELGTQPEIAEKLAVAEGVQWNEQATASIIVAFLFLCVAILGTALYLAQRHHPEYLWLALLCVAVAASGAVDACFGLGLLRLSAYVILAAFVSHIFMAVTLEFVLRFTASPYHRLVRGVQIALLLVSFFTLTPFDSIYDILAVAAEIVFCALSCVLLFLAWRKHRGDAGAMLLPFFLAAIAGSTDTVLGYGIEKHWLPERLANLRLHIGPVAFGTSTIAYSIFLASLVVVILYQFIRVSQDEQRSNAEVAAARSVQALLIPTQLPSTRNFVLESAYLPVNGVGGDFFQVLPLKDESLLIVVGDVSGKGLQAAMNSSTLVGALRNELSHDPATVLEHLNHVLLGAVSVPGAVPELDAAPCFATCLCARIYPSGEMTIANAGHLGPYRDGREIELPPGLPLGVIADNCYEQATFQLNRGERLVFLSDGVVEAANEAGELFGFERTQQVSNEPARYIAQTAKRFGQTDDITVVSLYFAARTAQSNSEQPAYSN